MEQYNPIKNIEILNVILYKNIEITLTIEPFSHLMKQFHGKTGLIH